MSQAKSSFIQGADQHTLTSSLHLWCSTPECHRTPLFRSGDFSLVSGAPSGQSCYILYLSLPLTTPHQSQYN